MSLSRYKTSAPGTVYHLFNRGNHKQEIFVGDEDYRMYRGLLRKFCKADNFSIIAFCFMPTHIHLLVRQNENSSPAKLMSRLHTSYVMYFNKKYGHVGHLFQDRYKQKIVADESYLMTLICYIHLNPVKDGLVDIAHRYTWSSCSEYKVRGAYRAICDAVAIESLGISDPTAIADKTQLMMNLDPGIEL